MDDAGIVDEHVEPAAAPDRLRHQLVRPGPLREVAGEELCLDVVTLRLLERGIPAFGRTTGEHEHRAGGGTSLGDGGTDARSGSGDEDRLARQVHGSASNRKALCRIRRE
jgi:hypothetical protein